MIVGCEFRLVAYVHGCCQTMMGVYGIGWCGGGGVYGAVLEGGLHGLGVGLACDRVVLWSWVWFFERRQLWWE